MHQLCFFTASFENMSTLPNFAQLCPTMHFSHSRACCTFSSVFLIGFVSLDPVLAFIVFRLVACCCVDGGDSSQVSSVIFTSHFSGWIVLVGLGEFFLVLAMSPGPVSVVVDAGIPLCGVGGGTNFVGEAGGHLGVRFWKQSNNWSMPAPVPDGCSSPSTLTVLLTISLVAVSGSLGASMIILMSWNSMEGNRKVA